MKKYNPNNLIDIRRKRENLVRELLQKRGPMVYTNILNTIRLYEGVSPYFSRYGISEVIQCNKSTQSAIVRLTYEGDIVCEKKGHKYYYRIVY